MCTLNRRFFTLILSLMTFFSSINVEAHECGDVLVRIRGLFVGPMDTSSYVIQDTSTVLGRVGVDESWTAELDFSYFFTSHLAAELILATSKHDIVGNEGAINGASIGSTWVLPPTLTFQYHLLPCCCFQPYVGLGINYTYFYSEDCDLASTDLDLSHSLGVAVQAGFDWLVDDCWFLNFDFKFVGISTIGHLKGGTNADLAVDLNPIIIGIGVGRAL